MDAKYIVVSTKPMNENGIEKLVVFDASLNHIDMAKAMSRLRYPFIISAGFINEFMECHGSSMTCRCSARGDIDTIMLHAMLNIDDKVVMYDN